MSRIVRHVRRNTIAYLALAMAMGGTSYAATELPPTAWGMPRSARTRCARRTSRTER